MPFGLVLGRTGSWAKNQSCSPHNALQYCLRDHSH
jgi:hypothetical protein